ncbi:Uncharacterised protein [Mycobacterium tuberculosis]|nr:Uncharacterised protein [Mycobacterium tuberculosis]
MPSTSAAMWPASLIRTILPIFPVPPSRFVRWARHLTCRPMSRYTRMVSNDTGR